jgi:hypothetical protein
MTKKELYDALRPFTDEIDIVIVLPNRDKTVCLYGVDFTVQYRLDDVNRNGYLALEIVRGG